MRFLGLVIYFIERMQLSRLAAIFTMVLSLCLIACSKGDAESVVTPDGGVEVGLWLGDDKTRTTINDDGISTSWSVDDKVALWAVGSDGSYKLSNQTFKLYFRDLPASNAFFTTTLASAMADDTYTYYATYPTPKSVSGTTATFNVPNIQDGTISSGAAVLVATPAEGGALGTVTHIPGNYEVSNDGLTLQMNHALHALRFYVPAMKWGFADGEAVERLEIAMPQPIAGDISLDYTSPESTPTFNNQSNNITLILAEPFEASQSASEIKHACASIFPTTAFSDGDQIEVKVYSATRAARTILSLSGRGAMLAGHITPVSLDCSNVVDRHYIRFIWNGNNLGEDVHTITFHTQAGDEIYRITDVASFVKTGYHDVDFTFGDKSILTAIAGQDIVVKYESVHALVSNKVTMPSDLATAKRHDVGITVPYLFFEDFSLLKGYDINGGNVSTKQQGGANINDTFFYSGWTGEQTSGQAGNAIRIRTRNETTWAFYNGRVDSAPISGLKAGASVKVSVSFDYNAVAEESGDECMSFSYGYTTKQGPIDAYWWYKPLFGSKTGGEHIENAKTVALPSDSNMASFDENVYPSSYHKIEGFEINGCTNKHRLSWEPLASGTNNHLMNSKNHWLYLDNIKVQIVQ